MAASSNDLDLEKGSASNANPGENSSLGVIDVQPGMLLPEMSYQQRLFHYTYSTADDKLLFMQSRLLQRLNLVHLQNELAQLKIAVWKDMSANHSDMQKLRVTMHEYTDAIRDFDYLQRLAECDKNEAIVCRNNLADAFDDIAMDEANPYHSEYRCLHPVSKHTGIDPLRDILRRRLPLSLAYSKEERNHQILKYYKAKIPPSHISPFVDHLARFIIAFASGTWLIVPMLIMSLHKSLTTSLVTTSVAVVLLAVFLSFVIRTTNSETIFMTAAYAAVLVVFIGAGS